MKSSTARIQVKKPKFWCHAILAAALLKNTFRHYGCKYLYDRGIESLDLLQTQLGVPTNLTDLDKLGRLNLVGNLGNIIVGSGGCRKWRVLV